MPTMTEPLYTRDILRLAASLEPAPPLDPADGRASLRSATCGARIEVAVRLGGDGRVSALTQKVEACGFGQASAALMGESAVGVDADEARFALAEVERWLAGGDLPAWPGLSALEPARARAGRHGAILLPFRALLAAIEDAT